MLLVILNLSADRQARFRIRQPEWILKDRSGHLMLAFLFSMTTRSYGALRFVSIYCGAPMILIPDSAI